MKQYAQRDVEALSEHYMRHVEAMTAERLHEKCHIAAELAWRDLRIERLEHALKLARIELSKFDCLTPSASRRGRERKHMNTNGAQKDFPIHLSNNRRGILIVPANMTTKDYDLLKKQIENNLMVIAETSVSDTEDETPPVPA